MADEVDFEPEYEEEQPMDDANGDASMGDDGDKEDDDGDAGIAGGDGPGARGAAANGNTGAHGKRSKPAGAKGRGHQAVSMDAEDR